MQKICQRGRNFIQVFNANGDVRICGWIWDGAIGSLLENTLSEIYHGEKARMVRERLINRDYAKCNVDSCPYLMKGTLNDFIVDEGELPKYPEELYIAFENTCNYRCTSCTVCYMNQGKSSEELEHNYDLIEARLHEALPYAKKISANGLGELFASPRTMRLLANWKPLAPAEECVVSIESNGSLFDEEHWKMIENIKKYHVNVTITVMSFDEPTYQRLSGVKYPIEKIENNLRFVKSLREKGDINRLNIGTVVQAENFRTLPEFARRCIEEFGADLVRLRPYDNWGAQNEVEDFFMDIRNPMHPWHNEYRQIMKDPIFLNPKVNDNSGGKITYNDKRRGMPNELSDLKWKLLTNILDNPDQIMEALSPIKNLVIYGMGNLTNVLVQAMKKINLPPLYIMDANKDSGTFEGVPVYNIKEVSGKEDITVLITPVCDVIKIKKLLQEHGFTGNQIPIWEIAGDEYITDRLKYINRL